MAINHAALAADLGVVFGAIKEANTFRGATLTTRSATFLSELSATYTETLSAARQAVARAPAALDGYATDLADVASRIVRDAVDADQLLPGGTTDLTAALREWRRQLIADGESLDDSTCTAASAASGAGDTTWLGYTVDETGVASDFVIPDRLFFSLDLYADNGGTRWAETWRVRSRPVDGSPLDAAYPRGHGLDTSLAAVDPASDGGLLADPSFDAYTAGAFTSWARVGSATATHVFQTADDPRDGASGFCATLKGDGTVVPAVRQLVAVTAGRLYAVHLLVRSIARPTATDRIVVSFRDSAGVTIAERNEVLNAANAWGTNASTRRVTAVFAVPALLPVDGAVYFDVRLTASNNVSAPANLTEQRVDFASVQELTPLTPRGLTLIGWSGLVSPDLADTHTVTTTLDVGTVGANFIRWLDRTMNVSALDFRFPTDGSPTISDSVIV